MAPIDRYDAPAPQRKAPLLVLAGVAAAAAAGVALALFALPKLNDEPAPPPDDKQVSIVVDPAKPQPLPKSSGQMEVLAPGMAEAVTPPPEPLPEAAASAQSALPASGPSFDCGGRLTRGQAMVCSDPELAVMDRRMARAYGEAIAAGAPLEELRADQADWRAIREDAAAHSPDAVAQIYEQRTRELEDLADATRR